MIKATAEFEYIYTFNERYYLAANGEQRVERTLSCNYGDCQGGIIAVENHISTSKSGALYKINQMMRELESPTSKRVERGCHTGDGLIGYSERSAERLRRVYLWLIGINVTVIILGVLRFIFHE